MSRVEFVSNPNFPLVRLLMDSLVDRLNLIGIKDIQRWEYRCGLVVLTRYLYNLKGDIDEKTKELLKRVGYIPLKFIIPEDLSSKREQIRLLIPAFLEKFGYSVEAIGLRESENTLSRLSENKKLNNNETESKTNQKNDNRVNRWIIIPYCNKNLIYVHPTVFDRHQIRIKLMMEDVRKNAIDQSDIIFSNPLILAALKDPRYTFLQAAVKEFWGSWILPSRIGNLTPSSDISEAETFLRSDGWVVPTTESEKETVIEIFASPEIKYLFDGLWAVKLPNHSHLTTTAVQLRLAGVNLAFGHLPDVRVVGPWAAKMSGNYTDKARIQAGAIWVFSELFPYLLRLSERVRVHSDLSLTFPATHYEGINTFVNKLNSTLKLSDKWSINLMKTWEDGITCRWKVNQQNPKARSLLIELDSTNDLESSDEESTNQSWCLIVDQRQIRNSRDPSTIPFLSNGINQDSHEDEYDLTITDTDRTMFKKELIESLHQCYGQQDLVTFEEFKDMSITSLTQILSTGKRSNTKTGLEHQTYCFAPSTIESLTGDINPYTRRPLTESEISKHQVRYLAAGGLLNLVTIPGIYSEFPIRPLIDVTEGNIQILTHPSAPGDVLIQVEFENGSRIDLYEIKGKLGKNPDESIALLKTQMTWLWKVGWFLNDFGWSKYQRLSPLNTRPAHMLSEFSIKIIGILHQDIDNTTRIFNYLIEDLEENF